MKYLLFLTLFSCATKVPLTNQKDELVHVSTVMDQVQYSYLKGCVDAFKELKLGPSFDTCMVKAKDHRLEIQSIMNQHVP